MIEMVVSLATKHSAQLLYIKQKPSSSFVLSQTINTMITYYVQYGDSLASIAQQFGTSYLNLKALNNLKTYNLYIGQALLVPDNNFDDCSDDSPNNERALPSQKLLTSDRQVPAFFNNTEARTYTVKAGDTLTRIAQQVGTTAQILAQYNNLSSTALFIGQLLRLPNNASTNTNNSTEVRTYTVKLGDSLHTIAWIFGIPLETLKTLNKLTNEEVKVGQVLILSGTATTNNSTNNNTTTNNTTNNNPSGSDKLVDIVHTVAAGDTLWRIAQKYGVSASDIIAWNKLSTNSLSVGQKLIVGKKSSTTSTTNNNTNTNNNNADTNTNNNTTNNNNSSSGNNNNNPTPAPIQSGAMRASNDPLQFAYKFTLSDTVGANARNYARDVDVVQTQLVRTGFLSPADANAEEPAGTDLTPISAAKLPRTIAAIKKFQELVVAIATPDGLIKPNSVTLMMLNSASMPPPNAKIDEVREALKAFLIKERNGRDLLANPLSAAVGNTTIGNTADDVSKVQQLLVRTGYLPISHTETPQTGTAISPALLPQTIAAIKKFQAQRVDFWRNMPVVAGSRSYIAGVVGKDDNDLTFKLLKEHTEYYAEFTDPESGKRVAVEFRNYVRSQHTVYPEGISLEGTVGVQDFSLKVFEDFGLNRIQARALKFVSAHEGKFDAINSFDKAIFSYGFIQFSGNGGGLAPMLALLKYRHPVTFRERFQRYGIDVEYAITDGDIRRANVTAIRLYDGKLVRRQEAEAYFKNSKIFTTIFIAAARDAKIQHAQIESAKRRYVVSALNIDADFTLPVVRLLETDKKSIREAFVGIKALQFKQRADYRSLQTAGRLQEEIIDFRGEPLTDIIRSEKGITSLIDTTVNRWVIAARQYFVDAITQIATDENLDTKAKVCAISEQKILLYLSKIDVPQIAKRSLNILNSTDLSFSK
jgi:LysM repeat protein